MSPEIGCLGCGLHPSVDRRPRPGKGIVPIGEPLDAQLQPERVVERDEASQGHGLRVPPGGEGIFDGQVVVVGGSCWACPRLVWYQHRRVADQRHLEDEPLFHALREAAALPVDHLRDTDPLEKHRGAVVASLRSIANWT